MNTDVEGNKGEDGMTVKVLCGVRDRRWEKGFSGVVFFVFFFCFSGPPFSSKPSWSFIRVG